MPPTRPTNAAFREAFKSLRRTAGEHDVRDALHDALRAIGANRFALEYQLPTGPVDMASPESRVLIETKARDAVGPTKPGSGSEETQKDQAERYLRDAREMWLGDLFQARQPDEPRVFLTDGIKWWGYEIGPAGRLSVVARNFRAASEGELASFLRRYVVPSERRYKLPVPDDLIGELLSTFANDLDAVYRAQESNAEVQTKIALWRECLRGAGIVPPDDEPVGQASLFVRHTVLVVAARTLKVLLRGEDVSTVRPLLEEMSDGFTAWLVECHEGVDTIRRIAEKLDEYQWRGDTRDRLKEAYHKLIAREERKEFGEYYTPDWLAERVVAEMLDETWMDVAIRRAAAEKLSQRSLDGHTVLDPACGSGTFLFHAARRLFRHISERHPRRLRHARRIVARLVVGIDVHPIAVEMAEATLEMALPPPAADDAHPLLPQVFLGDALQATRRDDLSKDRMVTTSARGTDLTVPTVLAVHPESDVLISRLVRGAVQGESVAFPEIADSVHRGSLSQTLADLTRIVKEESNHVWVWHLRNIAGPVRLARTKAGRIVANPPWLMANDTPDGSRKNNIDQLRDEYGLRNQALRRRKSSTAGDLAAVFAARAAHLYLVASGKMGLVLPGGVLINQNWEPWRQGCWHSPANPGCHMDLIRAWGMNDLTPPPFPHTPSGSCVVFCERLGEDSTCQPDRTGLRDEDVGLWSGSPDAPSVRPKRSMAIEPSAYLDNWRIGAQSKPHGLLYVLKEAVDPVDKMTRKIRTKRSTKPPWRGLSLDAVVEVEALRELATPQALDRFKVNPDTYLIAPLVADGKSRLRIVAGVDDEQFAADLPLTLEYWKRASAEFHRRRAESAGATLLHNLDYKNTLSQQMAAIRWSKSRSRSRTKVIYNESGTSLKAARCSPAVIANQSLYWLNAETEEEALYLCGIINAECMQAAWRASKTAQMHFDKSPWRKVPVPRFDGEDRQHRAVVESARAIEAALLNSSDAPLEVREEDDFARLDRAVSSLMPRYAGL